MSNTRKLRHPGGDMISVIYPDQDDVTAIPDDGVDMDEWIRTHPPAIRTDRVTRDEVLRRLAGTGPAVQLVSDARIRVVSLLDSASIVQWWSTA